MMVEPKCADFEEAIQATGYGKFNIFLLLIAMQCCISTIFEPGTTAYIIPSAECDLQLSLVTKGWLNAINYAGMVTSAIPWGYAADTWGRRKPLVCGLLMDTLCLLASAMSQNVWQLMLFKYLGGVAICGPFAVLMSYFSEFHGIKYRSNVTMILGMSMSMGSVIIPIIGLFVIPLPWRFVIGESFIIRSWQFFMMICALPSLLGSIGVMVFLPESPKFLMFQGRNEEALQAMRTIFRWNTGRPGAEFPIERLVDERQASESSAETTAEVHSGKASILNGLLQMMPLFRKPLLGKLLLVLALNTGLLTSLNTMRLWMPQLYAMVSNFEVVDSIVDFPYEKNLCGMIAFAVNQTNSNMQSIATDGTCEVREIKPSVYMNASYSGMSGVFGSILAAVLMNYFEAKHVLVVGLAIVASSAIGMVWALNSVTTVILTSVYVSTSNILSIALIGLIVTMFPTSLRTTTIAVAMMSGRLGSLAGNVLFPYLLSMGCMPSFFFLGGLSLLCSLISLALPRSRNVALK